MKDNHRRNFGQWGESTAVSYLVQKGYRILERNYRTPYGELDIIAQESDYLVFVEVKTRKNTQFGSPLEAVTYAKQQHLRRAAEIYLIENPTDLAIRFDVIAILKKSGQAPQIEHIYHAF